MLRSRSLALLMSLSAAAFVLAGCSSYEKPVLKVGRRTMTLSEFASVASGNEAQYQGLPMDSKRALLEDLERREMMIAAAMQAGYDTSSFAHSMRADLEERTGVQALMEQLAPADQRVTKGEAQRLFEWRSEQYEVSAIYSLDEATIRMAKHALDAGEPFAQVSMRFSVGGMLPAGGALGFVTPGQLIAPLDGALRTLHPGEVGGPYSTTQGWFLLKVTGRKSRPQPSYELQESVLSDMLRQRKQRQATADAFVALRREYEVQAMPGGSQALFHHLQDSSPEGVSTVPDATVLAVYRGGRYTLADAKADLQRSDRQKPPASLMSALTLWIESMVTNRLLWIEAQRRHLNQEPRLAARVRQQFENYLAESMYNGATVNISPPTPEDVAVVWSQMKSQYQRLDQAHVLTLVVADSAMARTITLHGGHSGTLREAAAMVDPALVVEESTIAFPTQDPRWEPMEQMFLRMQPTEWAGPQPVANGLLFVQLLDKRQSEQDFATLPPQLQQQLATNAFEMKREVRFKEYCDSLRVALKPARFEANLAPLEWPVPQPIDVGH